MKKIILNLICLVLLFGLCACSNVISDATQTDNSAGSIGTVNNSGNMDNKSDKKYKRGETADISATYGTYHLTFTDIVESDVRNEYADSQPERIIIVKYLYENVDCTQDITISYLYFRAYDSEGNLLDIYPSIEVEYPNTISAGGKKTASVAYALNDDINYIRLQFYNVDYSDMFHAECTFELEW
ncbi:MAG: hypothetical protein ACI3XS_04455 [Eubacteriales bacterium]